MMFNKILSDYDATKAQVRLHSLVSILIFCQLNLK